MTNVWTHVGSFCMGVSGVLVTIGILWGKLNAKVEVQSASLEEIKDALKPLAAVPQLMAETREDVRDLRDRVHEVEVAAWRRTH